jgi:hypothetical protein
LGTLVGVPSPNRRLEGTQATDAEILRRGIALVALTFVVGGALLIGSAVFGGPDRSAAPRPAPVSTPPTVAETTSAVPSPSVSPSRTPTRKPRPKPTRAGMERFLSDYLATVARDPASAWTRLTASFRNTSGGFASYRQFWETVTRAEPRDVVADPGALTVQYAVTYTRRDGSTTSDSTRLRLVFQGGAYLIDGEG